MAAGLSPRCRPAGGVAQPRGIEARRGRDLEQGSMRSTKARTRQSRGEHVSRDLRHCFGRIAYARLPNYIVLDLK